MVSLRSNTVWLLVCCIAILLPILSFPISPDLATFIISGRSMLDGGLLYVDVIDVKPPLLYLIVGIVSKVFGGSAISLRLFDLVWQSATLYLLIRLLQKNMASPLWTWCTALLYALLYTSLGHETTIQAETFFALPLLGVLNAVDKPPSWTRNALIGLLAGAVFLLKYTLGIVAPAAIVYFLLRGEGWKQTVTSAAQMALASFVIIGVIVWPMLADPRFIPALSDMFSYLRVYSPYQSHGLWIVADGLKTTAGMFGDNLSLMVCIAAAFGLISSSHRLVYASAFVGLLLFFTVLLEGKYFPYHFARLLIPLSIISGAGTATFLPRLRTLLRESRWLNRATIGLAMATALLFSPLPRVANIAVNAVKDLFSSDPLEARFASNPTLGDRYRDNVILGQYLTEHIQPADHVMSMSALGSPMLSTIPTKHVGPFMDSHLYFGVGSRDKWKELAFDQLRRADWVVVDTKDVAAAVTMHEYTSLQSLQSNKPMSNYVNENFVVTDSIGRYLVYTRKK